MSEKQNAEILELVTDELLAHGEFSASGNNRRNAHIAAQAVIAIIRSAPSPHPRGEPVAWRWRSHGASLWIYDPEPSWFDAHRNEIEHQPLYAAPPPAGADAVRMIGKVSDILRRRAAGYEARATAIFNGRIMADELRENARRVEALADSILPAPQPQEKPTGDQT